MVTLSRKVLAVIITVAVILTIIAMLAIFYKPFGEAVSGFGGPVGAGIVTALSAPLQWALSGGGPTLAVFYGLALAIIFGFAYWVWHWNIGYKITGITAASELPSHSVTHEPEEPERAPQPQSVSVEQ